MFANTTHLRHSKRLTGVAVARVSVMRPITRSSQPSQMKPWLLLPM